MWKLATLILLLTVAGPAPAQSPVEVLEVRVSYVESQLSGLVRRLDSQDSTHNISDLRLENRLAVLETNQQTMMWFLSALVLVSVGQIVKIIADASKKRRNGHHPEHK